MIRSLTFPREKPLNWVGASKKDYLAFPQPVQSDMGYALGLAQLGGKHPKAKPWKGGGAGVFEIAMDYGGDAFRVVYTVRFPQVVYVIHVFQKKSTSGKKTPKADVDLIGERLRRAAQHYTDHYAKAGTRGKDNDRT